MKSLELILDPVTYRDLALFAGGSNDHNPIHLDRNVAKEAGYEDVFAQGMLSMAFLGRLLTDHFAQEQLQQFGVRFCDIVQVGDQLTCIATLKPAAPADLSGDEYELEVWANKSHLVLKGHATLKNLENSKGKI